MYDINLVPEKRYDNNTLAKTVVTVISGVILIAFLIFYGIIDPLRQQYYVEQMYRIHSSQMARLETTASEHATTSAYLEQLRIRREGLRVLFDEKLPASLLVLDIENSIPSGVYLISKNYTEGDIALQGHALSSLEVADLSIGLKNTELFEFVRTISIERDLTAGNSPFLMNLKLRKE